MKMWTYRGINVYPADRNSSGIRWYARTGGGVTLKSDNKDDMRLMIRSTNARKNPSEDRKTCNRCKGERFVEERVFDRAGRSRDGSKQYAIIPCPQCGAKGYLTKEDREEYRKSWSMNPRRRSKYRVRKNYKKYGSRRKSSRKVRRSRR